MATLAIKTTIKTPKLVLLAMAFLGPIALNVYPPIMPTLTAVFASSADTIQLGMTIFLLFFAISQLSCGLFVEIFGQRNVLLMGVALYIVGCIAAIAGNDIYWMIFARILQAIGGGFSLLLTRSIILEQNSPNKAAAKLSYVALGIATLQAIVPTLSGYLNVHFSWHLIFYLSLMIALVALIAIYIYLPSIALSHDNTTDENQAEKILAPSDGFIASTPLSIKQIMKTYLNVLFLPRFFYLALSNALISGGFFVFVLNVPFIVSGSLAGSSLDYGNWYLLVALGFWVGSFIASQISERMGNHTMLMLGWGIATVAAFIMIATILIYGVSYWALFLPMTLFTFGRGISLPNAQASAVNVTPYNRSTSMGIFSFCQLIIGALLAQFSIFFVKQSIIYLPIAICVLAFLALVTYSKALKSNANPIK